MLLTSVRACPSFNLSLRTGAEFVAVASIVQLTIAITMLYKLVGWRYVLPLLLLF